MQVKVLVCMHFFKEFSHLTVAVGLIVAERKAAVTGTRTARCGDVGGEAEVRAAASIGSTRLLTGFNCNIKSHNLLKFSIK